MILKVKKYFVILLISGLPVFTVMAEPLCSGKSTTTNKIICSDNTLIDEYNKIDSTYDVLLNALIVNRDTRLTKFKVQHKKWIKSINSCSNKECVTNLYIKYQQLLQGIMNSSPSCGEIEDLYCSCKPYQVAIKPFLLMKAALDKNSPQLFINSFSESGTAYRYAYVYISDGSDGKNSYSPVFLNYDEFKQYFSLLFKPIIASKSKFGFGFSDPTTSRACDSGEISLGYNNDSLAFRSSDFQDLTVFYTVSFLPNLLVYKIPDLVNQLSEKHYKSFQKAKSVIGLYADDDSALVITQISKTKLGLDFMYVDDQGQKKFLGEAIYDPKKSTNEFIFKSLDAKKNDDNNCLLSVKFSPTTAKIDILNDYKTCSKYFFRDYPFQTYYRVTDGPPEIIKKSQVSSGF